MSTSVGDLLVGMLHVLAEAVTSLPCRGRHPLSVVDASVAHGHLIEGVSAVPVSARSRTSLWTASGCGLLCSPAAPRVTVVGGKATGRLVLERQLGEWVQ